MMRFTLPRDIYYGKDSLEVLKTVKGKKLYSSWSESELVSIIE